MTKPTQALTPEEQKKKQVETWAAASPGYAKHVIEEKMIQGVYGEFAAALVPELQDVPHAKILDIAAASGEPSLTLARALPTAHVVATDLAEPYLELGKARAAAAGVTNIEFQTADAENLAGFADASFDAVTCSLGLMFMPSVDRALSEIHRTLKPGSRFVAAVWQTVDNMRFFGLTVGLARDYDPESVPEDAANTAARFGDPAELLKQMEAAGFTNISCQPKEATMAFSPGRCWQALLEMPLPIAPALRAAEQRGHANVYEEARQKLEKQLSEIGALKPDGSVVVDGCWLWFITATA